MPIELRLKQRLIGAAVLVALVVIVLPMLINAPTSDSGVSDLSFQMPAPPATGPQSGGLPSAALQDASVVQDNGAVSVVDETSNDVRASAEALATQSVAPEPILPPTAADGKYVVHFASFATQADADVTVSQLQARRLPAFTESVILNSRPAVRVRVGPYTTQAEAEIVRVQAAQLREDVQPRVFMLIDDAAAERAATALEQASLSRAVAPEVGFVVQLGAFGNRARATRLQERLRQAGIVAFTDTVSTSQGTLTRVNVGPVSSRNEAERLKARVKSAVEMDGIVRSHP